MKHKNSLNQKYPPSEPCGCPVCLNYCKRPGWWTVKETEKAIDAGYGNRMMLEMSPELAFAVLSPAFKGCEVNFAYHEFSHNGCNFLKNNLCELHGNGHMPLECRFCHHDRIGLGQKCHADLEKDWNTYYGRELIDKWIGLTNFNGADYYYNLVKKKSR